MTGMRIGKYAILLGSFFLLSHCATKHQPIAFAPYFSEDSGGISFSRALSEIHQLENNASLTPLAKKRLSDLYQWEIRGLKQNSTRHAELTARIEKLKPEVGPFEEEVREVQKDNTTNSLSADRDAGTTPKVVLNNPVLKKEYSDILKQWNTDQTEAALQRIEDLKTGPLAEANRHEKMRFLNIKLRMLLELGNFDQADKTYREMRDIEACDSDVTQAAFYLALHRFAAKDSAAAFKIFDDQCDSDESPSNKVRRLYWEARFNPNLEKAKSLYKEVVESSKMPGYHAFLAQIQMGERVNVAPTLATDASPRIYLREELSVSGKVHRLLSSAEERLGAGLRRDASIYLSKASRLLREDPDEDTVLPALYTAHLAHAAGNHLEAMRLYTSVANLILEDQVPEEWITPHLLADMFPRPFPGKIEWVSRIWRVDPDFVYSIIRQESAFNPGAVSLADARGLMQMMPALARTLARQWNYKRFFTERSLFYADENLKLGVFHINQLREWVPHYALIAASYNAGLNRVLRWWRRNGDLPLDVFVELIPITETRNYVKLVMRNFVYYKWLRYQDSLDPNVIPMALGTLPKEIPKDPLSLSTAGEQAR